MVSLDTELWKYPKIRGEVELVTPDGVRLFVAKNLVVNNSKPLTLRALVGVDPQTYVLKYMALGTGTTPPREEDVSLENEALRVEISSYTFPDNNSVILEAYVDYGEGNGITFTEAGLFSGPTSTYPQGLMFSRLLFPKPVEKTEALAFYIRWKLTAL